MKPTTTGRPPNRGPNQTLQILRVPKRLLARISAIAGARGTTRNELIIATLQQLADREAQPKQ